jgi:hypothetical protein
MINYANMVPYQKLGVADPVAVAIDATGIGWLSVLVKFAALAGLTTVIFVLLFGQPVASHGDREIGGDTSLSSEVFTRPQSHRAALQQVQNIFAQSSRTHYSGPHSSNSLVPPTAQPSRMFQLFHARRLRFNMNVICFSFHQFHHQPGHS